MRISDWSSDVCSSDLWLASAADKVFMPKLGTAGSIGAVILHAEMSKALEEEGINVTIFRSKDGKMRGNAMEVLDEATKALFQGMVDEEIGLASCMERVW